MTLPASGTISLSQIQAEFGGPSPAPINNYYRGGTYVPNFPLNNTIPTSGQINLSDFYSTSKGTITWTARSFPVSLFNAPKVAFGGGSYIVASSTSAGAGRIMASTDGVTWVASATSAASQAFTAAAIGGGTYVVMGRRTTDNACNPYTSATASGSYTQRANVATNFVPNGMTYSSSLNMFVAVGSLSGAAAMYTSTSAGVTWSVQTSAFTSSPIRGVAWGNSTFVAVGSGGKIASSTNGTTWTLRTNPFSSNTVEGVTFANGLFVAVSELGATTVATSPDGITWTARTGIKGSAAGAGLVGSTETDLVVSTQSGAPNAAISYNGFTWHSTPKAVSTDILTGAVGGAAGRFVVVGQDSAATTARVYTVDIT